MSVGAREEIEVDEANAWPLLLAIKQWARAGAAEDLFLAAAPDNKATCLVRGRTLSDVLPGAVPIFAASRDGVSECLAPMTPAASQLLDLYLPLALANQQCRMTLGHLGQSLDGRIATVSGASHYINGPDNIVHLHRLRALADAVIVGWRTVASDNSRLTVREVEGDNPLRVVIDPKGRLPSDRKLLHDAAAPTVVMVNQGVVAPSEVEVCGIASNSEGTFSQEVLERLHARGCVAVFVEGGGRTVSSFLQAGLLDRLQIAVAPLIIGSGTPAITLPPVDSLDGALRPPCRTFAMGNDVLFDLDLRG